MATTSDHTDETVEVRVCVAATIALTVEVFYRGQFDHLFAKGFRFTVLTGPDGWHEVPLPPHVRQVVMPLRWSMSPLQDLLAVWKMVWFFRRNRFDLVQYCTPKAALLVSLAAFLAGVPQRLYLMWGIYYVAQSGWRRRIFKSMEKLACRLSTHISPDSQSNREFAAREGLFPLSKSSVVGSGSANGIDLRRFDPSALADGRRRIRQEWDIPDGAFVFGSVMRLIRDKGVNELVKAFDLISRNVESAYLLLVGSQEGSSHLDQETQAILASNTRIRRTGRQADVAPYYTAMDLFVLPTYREGFGVVNLEAAAMCLPVITTDTDGVRESIEPGVTGLLVPVRAVEPLRQAMLTLMSDPQRRADMGRAGRRRVQEKFEQSIFWHALELHRRQLLNRPSAATPI